MDCHFLCDKLLEGTIRMEYVACHEQLADLLTKLLDKATNKSTT